MKTKIIAIGLASLLILESCQTSSQASAGFAGAAIGARVGESIGFLSGRGYTRGRNAAIGSLVGMAVGAAAGVAAESSIERRVQKRTQTQPVTHKSQRMRRNNHNNSEDIYQYQGSRQQTYTDTPARNYEPADNSADYQTQGGAYMEQEITADSIQVAGDYLPQDTYTPARNFSSTGGYSLGFRGNSNLAFSQVSFFDGNGDGLFSKGETIEVETFIKNTTGVNLDNVTIVLDVAGKKNFYTSPEVVTSIECGKEVKYVGRVFCGKAKNNDHVNVTVRAYHNGTCFTSETITINTIK